MKKVLIIGRRDFGEKNNIQDIAAGLNQQGDALSVETVFFDQLTFVITNEQRRVFFDEQDIAAYDLIIILGWTTTKVYSDMAAVIAMYLEEQGKPYWNTELKNARSMTKLSQLFIAAQNNTPLTASVFSLAPALLQKAAEKFLRAESYIIKDITASRGRRNFKCGVSEIESLLSEHEGVPMIAQEYIANDGSDYRIVILGGQALGIQRFARGGHLTNISAGGKAELVTEQLSPQLISEATRLAKIFKREICGVDFMFNTASQEFVFLEVNMTPQITNGVFAEEKLQYLYAGIKSKVE